MSLQSARRNCFDALRLFAALAVVVQHSVTHLGAPLPWYSLVGRAWFYDGVTAFFILSGLMVFRSAERCADEGRPWREFYRNRALRIIPAVYAYVIVAVVALLAVGALAVRELMTPQGAVFLTSHALLAPVYHPPMLADFGVGVLNGSLWTIPVEVSFYLIVPLLVLAAKRTGPWVMLAVLATVSAAAIGAFALIGGAAAEGTAAKLYSVTFLPWLWFFVIGIAWSRLWVVAPKSGWLAAAGLATYAALAWVRAGLEPGGGVLLTALAAVPLSYSLVWLGYHGPKVLRRLPDRIGDLSFGTYIWHMPVVNLLIFYGARDWAVPGLVKVLAAVVVSLVLAAFSWWLVERPALRRKNYSLRGAAPLVVTEPPAKSPSRR